MRGIVFFCHGYGDHVSRMDSVLQSITAGGYIVATMDHQGHGNSQGDRAYVESFGDYVVDFDEFQSFFLAERPELARLPRYCMGISMGGLIALLSAAQDVSRYAGLVLLAPAIVPDPAISTPTLLFAAQILSQVLPKMTLSGLDPAKCTRNQEAIRGFLRDPLTYKGGFTVRWGGTFYNAMLRARSLLRTFSTPILLLHGSDDQVCRLEGSKEILASVASRKKELIVYDGFYHDLLSENNNSSVYHDILHFLNSF